MFTICYYMIYNFLDVKDCKITETHNIASQSGNFITKYTGKMHALYITIGKIMNIQTHPFDKSGYTYSPTFKQYHRRS